MKTLLLSLLMLCLAGAAVAQSPVKDINTVQTGGTYLWPFNAEFVEINGGSPTSPCPTASTV